MTRAIGLAGTGRSAAEIYAPSLASWPKTAFAGVWSPSPDATRALAERHSVPAYDRFAELLDHCDAVAFAVPPAAQSPLAVIAAGRHKHVLLRPPIAGELAGAEELADVVAATDVISQIALTWRYSPTVRSFLSSQVERTHPQGGTGRLISAALAGDTPARPWRPDRGVLMDMGVDVLDLLDAALGHTASIRAHGEPWGWVGLLLEHEGGRFSEVSLYATASADEPARAEVEVFGSGGSAVIDGAEVTGPEAYATMVEEFADAIERHAPHPLDVRHGLHLQRLLDAATTDLLTGR
ncbi:Gfo/Idh/MocA family protein [Actinoallomurus iriomotensis]|uniref:Dehydrogenase n=1 Tax=Actinoallomurus iriomotensis TaxID=478107 RepID=A0A9W6RDC5_9ACTN|nr:Gfo/Idh/MocA family oxidoreductase [Actinoallomurus iriomotensis]GLY73693.1 dehydrogenase [Actinoallomurus iriomotensis]